MMKVLPSFLLVSLFLHSLFSLAGESDEEEDVVEHGADQGFAAEERKFVSRNQWIRYMIKITGSLWNEPAHWLWWGRDLAEHYILSYWNRIQTEKVLYIKHHQKDLRTILPQTLIDAYQRKLDAWAKHSNCTSPVLYYFCF